MADPVLVLWFLGLIVIVFCSCGLAHLVMRSLSERDFSDARERSAQLEVLADVGRARALPRRIRRVR